MKKEKIANFISVLKWAYSSPPNNVLTGSLAVLRLLFWTAYVKRFCKPFIGSYLSLPFYFDTKSDGCAALYSNPYPEYALHRFIEFWVSKGDALIDIGSNVGYYPLLAGARGAHVLSFEPNPDVLHIQHLNILLNGLQNQVQTFNLAVSDKVETATFYLQDKGHSLVSSLVTDTTHTAVPTAVQCVTLDSVLVENKVQKVALLKVDVEGAEKSVFEGARNTLQQGKVKAISWETNGQGARSARAEVIKMLSTYGFKHFGFDILGSHIHVRPWADTDMNCLSIHTSVLKKFAAFQ